MITVTVNADDKQFQVALVNEDKLTARTAKTSFRLTAPTATEGSVTHTEHDPDGVLYILASYNIIKTDDGYKAKKG